MEELMEMRELLQSGRYSDALVLLGEMEEMAKDDKINKIESYLQVLLLHLIKQQAEQRSTRSWDISVANAVDAIQSSNRRRKAGGFYLTADDLWAAIAESYTPALRRASLEALEGQLKPEELDHLIDAQAIHTQAFILLMSVHPADYQ